MISQAAYSPDQNILDFGCFRCIESLQQEQTANTLDELILQVKEAYANYDPRTLNRVWLTHQQCMIKCMEERGGNSYKIPHINKGALERQGILPTSLHFPLQLVNQTRQIVDAADAKEVENYTSSIFPQCLLVILFFYVCNFISSSMCF